MSSALHTPDRIARATGGFDVHAVRADFPILAQQVNGKPLVYLDNAATSQKPQAVIDALVGFYTQSCANVHRGVHALSQTATKQFEGARKTVATFLNARRPEEIVFVRGATEGINLVASTFGRQHVGAGDEILISAMEHHSNIVPWQMLCEEKGAKLQVIPIDAAGDLVLDDLDSLLNERTKLVALVHVSNALGTVNPVKTVIDAAHAKGIPVLIDGCQSVPHMAVDLQALDADFFVFSGHKVMAPTGIGVLYGKYELLDTLPPYQGGGDMIETVSFTKSTYAKLPARLEAGTPDIGGVIGLAAALDYLSELGLDRIAAYEAELLAYATKAVQQVPGLRLIGTAKEKASVLSFVLDGIHPHDVGTILDHEGIAVRAGHHCAQPVMEHFQVPATSRASFAFYNTHAEIDALVAGLHKVVEILG